MTNFTKLSPEDLARVTTRDGRKVEIITTKGRGAYPVVGYVALSEWPATWQADGGCGVSVASQNCYDLILPPAPRVYYANAYPEGVLYWHASLESARKNHSNVWLALYKITDDGVDATIEVIERNREA